MGGGVYSGYTLHAVSLAKRGREDEGGNEGVTKLGGGRGGGGSSCTLHALMLVECTLMAGNKFWKRAVASFKCSSPPKLFITTSGAVCTQPDLSLRGTISIT